jgi:hypothetical protein
VKRFWAVILAAGLLAAPAATASAHEDVRKDGNDVRGPLDLRAAAVGHKGEGSVTHTLTTYGSWKPKLLRGGSYFAIAFDTDADPTDFERCAFALYQNGLHGQLSNCGRRKVGKVDVRKPSARSIEFTVGLRKLLGPEGGDYRWEAFSFYRNDHGCAKACSDSVPNHPPLLLHDLTSPQVTPRSFPDPTTNVSADTSFAVEFGVSDNGGSGIASWKLRQRPMNGTKWMPVGDGNDGGHQSVNVDAAEGDQLQFQVIAVDQQGNRTAGAPNDERVTVPIDDEDGSITYSSGDWTAPSAGNGGYFERTRHHTVTTGATASFSVTSTVQNARVRILGGPGNSAATMTIDGGTPIPLDPETSATTRRAVIGNVTLGSPGKHDVVIAVASGPFNLDGYAFSDY